MNDTIESGTGHPLGTTPRAGGVNFAVYSEDCSGLELLLFDAVDDPEPARVIRLGPAHHRTCRNNFV